MELAGIIRPLVGLGCTEFGYRLAGRLFRLAFSAAIVAVVEYLSVPQRIASGYEHAYISQMHRWVAAYFFGPLLLCLWLAPLPVRAQAESKSDSAPPSASDVEDERASVARPKVVIDEVMSDAPIHLPYSDLEPAIEVLNKAGRSPDSPWLDEFLEIGMRAVWQDRGYFKVKVDGRAEPRGSDGINQHFSVILHVDEGLQYRLGAVTFYVAPSEGDNSRVVVAHNVEPENGDVTANPPDLPRLRRRSPSQDHVNESVPQLVPIPPSDPPAFPVEQLRQLIPLREGDILIAGKIRQGLENLKHLYAHAGYIDFTATPFSDADGKNQTVDIRMELDEQRQYRFGRIEVVGLAPDLRNSLTWPFKPGDVFDIDKYDQFFEVNKSALPPCFSQTEAELRRSMQAGIVDVRFTINPCE